MQFLESLPANLNSSMIEGHAGALSWYGLGCDCVTVVCEECCYLAKDKIKLVPTKLAALHPHTIVVVPGEERGARLALIPLAPATFLQERTKVRVLVYLCSHMHCMLVYEVL